MNAGTLSVSVQADMNALDAQFATIERKFVESGKRAVEAFQKASAEQPLPADDMVDRLAAEIKNAGKEAGLAFAREVGNAIRNQMPKAVEQSIKSSMPTAVENAVKGGTSSAMKKAGDQGGVDFSENFQKRALGMVKGFAGPMIASQLANTVAGILRSDKSMPEAILDGIKSIPFVGAFANLGEAIYEVTFGAADKAAQDFIDKQAAARADILAARGEQQRAERASSDAAGRMMIETRLVEIAREFEAVKRTGDEQAIARAEFEKLLAEQNLDLELKMGQDISDIELNALLKLNEQKQLQLEENLLGRLEVIRKEKEAEDKRAAERKKDDDRRAKEKADDDEKRRLEKQRREERDTFERARKEMEFEEDKAKRIEELQSERERSQAAGIGSAQTALGSFKFDAYPATEKKKNDERLIGIMTAIRDQQYQIGFA